MTPEEFNQWLADMKAAGIAKSDAACARLLGVSSNTILAMKQVGVTGAAGKRTALACAALLAGLAPYCSGSNEEGGQS